MTELMKAAHHALEVLKLVDVHTPSPVVKNAITVLRKGIAAPVAKLEPLSRDEIFCALNETAMGAQSKAGYPTPNVLVELVRAVEAAHNAKLSK